VSIENRVAITRAALADMGRSDLADLVISAAYSREAFPSNPDPPLYWTGLRVIPVADEVLLRRAAAIASLSDGYDSPNVFCEPCIIERTFGQLCGLVTRRQFLNHEPCSNRDPAVPL